MKTTVVPNIPLALLAFTWGSPALAVVSVPGTSSVASLEWATSEELPTQSYRGFLNTANHSMEQVDETLNFLAVAKSVMPDGRSLKDWEKEDIDEFFWSQFQ